MVWEAIHRARLHPSFARAFNGWGSYGAHTGLRLKMLRISLKLTILSQSTNSFERGVSEMIRNTSHRMLVVATAFSVRWYKAPLLDSRALSSDINSGTIRATLHMSITTASCWTEDEHGPLDVACKV